MSLGALIVRRRAGQHDESIPDRHFSVSKPPVGRREASCLRESKHFGQPFQGGNAVLIGQKRNHVWHLVLLWPCHEGFEQTRTLALPSRPCRLTSELTGRCEFTHHSLLITHHCIQAPAARVQRLVRRHHWTCPYFDRLR